METGATAEPLRHRQTKGAETDTLSLTSTAPHSYSTLLPAFQPLTLRPPNIRHDRDWATYLSNRARRQRIGGAQTQTTDFGH